jgi:hypothetical protein
VSVTVRCGAAVPLLFSCVLVRASALRAARWGSCACGCALCGSCRASPARRDGVPPGRPRRGERGQGKNTAGSHPERNNVLQ